MKKNRVSSKRRSTKNPNVELTRLEDLVEILDADQLRSAIGGNSLPRPREDVGGN